MKKIYLFYLIFMSVFFSCKTVDLENTSKIEKDKSIVSPVVNSEQEFLVQEDNNTISEPTIVYIEKPVYIPYAEKSEVTKKKGIEATVESLEKATIKPENYKDGTFYYTYNENWVYEIYAQPYHLTDIILEEGEVVMGKPLLSEDGSVWELTANVAINPETGIEIQHLFLKPAYTNLDSSMIIITNRRVYHFRVKSFNNTHMAMVKFNYPNTKNVWATLPNKDEKNIKSEYTTITNPEFLSFDYKIKYGIRKPEFLPERVYDDGSKTYIVVDDIVLHKELPLIFNEKNEIVNYQVQKNVFVVSRLVNKLTLRLGKEKVIIEKKKSKKTNNEED